jgi:hypothetical protein
LIQRELCSRSHRVIIHNESFLINNPPPLDATQNSFTWSHRSRVFEEINQLWRFCLKLIILIGGQTSLEGWPDVTPHVTETLKKVINKWLGAVTSLNQKTEFKNKVSDSNYREINPNFLFKWNSKFWSSFDENLFFLALRCNQELASQISSKSKVLEIFSEFLSKFNS